MTSAEPLEIRVLGGFEVARGSDSDLTISASAARCLLAFLAIHRERRHVRAHIAGTLWPDEPEPKALRKLSQALWRLRTAIGADAPELLHTTQDSVEIAADARLDVDLHVFEERMERLGRAFAAGERVELATVRGTVDAYRGGLLPGWYDAWLDLPRERLRRRYVHTLVRAREAFMDERAHGAALEIAERVIDEEPYHEAHVRSLLRVLAWMDRRPEAIRRYDAWRARLRDEMELDPAEETQALVAELRRSVRTAPAPAAERPDIPLLDPRGVPFVARSTERGALVDVLDAIGAGDAPVALVRGDPGVGKSRLLRELRSDATWRGIDVLAAGASEAAREPFGLLRASLEPALQGIWLEQLLDLVDPLSWRELARVVPELRSRVGRPWQDQDARVGEALSALLVRWSDVRPVAIVWDDVQWADAASLDALRTALHGAGGANVGAIVAFRGDEAAERADVRAWLRDVDRETFPTRVDLGPLDLAGTLELIVRALALGHRPEAFAERLHRATGGNPLFVTETLRSLMEGGSLFRDEAGVWHTGVDDVTADYEELPLTGEIETTILRRIERLEHVEASTLEAAAVFAEPIDLSTLVETVPEAPTDVHAAVRSLVDRGLLGEQGGRLSLVHDLVREAVDRQLAPADRTEWHARVARTLEASGGAPGAIGRHAREGGLPELAFSSFRRAGEAARDAAAYASAADFFAAAYRLAPAAGASDAERYAVGTDLERAYDVLGRREEQGELLDELVACVPADAGSRSQLATRRAWFHAHRGALDRSVEHAEQAAALGREAGNDVRIADALHVWGAALEMRGRSGEAREKLARAAELAATAGDRGREARIRHLLATSFTGAERYEHAPAAFEAAVELSRDAEDPVLEARALNSLAAVRMESGDTAGADDLYRQAVELAEGVGHREALGLALANWGNLAYVQGDVRTALDRYDRASSVFDRAGDRGRAAQVRVNAASVRSTILGEHDRAEDDLRGALAFYEEVEDLAGMAHALDNLGIVAWHRDDLLEAERLLRAGRERIRRSEDTWMEAYNCRSLALVLLERGALEGASAAVERGLELTGELGLTDLGASLAGVRAVVTAESGAHDEALDQIDDVLGRAGAGVQQRYLLHAWRARILRLRGDEERSRQEMATAYERLLAALEGLSVPDRARSLERVKPHRRIRDGYAAHHRIERTVRLASEAAPLGRELDDDEYVDVTWTISEPEDATVEGRIARRRRVLQRLAREAGDQGAAPTVADLAEALDVSASTVKRDLAAIREHGGEVVTRGHG